MHSKIVFVPIKWNNFAIIEAKKKEEWILGEAYVTHSLCTITIYDGLRSCWKFMNREMIKYMWRKFS